MINLCNVNTRSAKMPYRKDLPCSRRLSFNWFVAIYVLAQWSPSDLLSIKFVFLGLFFTAKVYEWVLQLALGPLGRAKHVFERRIRPQRQFNGVNFCGTLNDVLKVEPDSRDFLFIALCLWLNRLSIILKLHLGEIILFAADDINDSMVNNFLNVLLNLNIFHHRNIVNLVTRQLSNRLFL